MNKREIPLSIPSLDGKIVENLKECIETGWVSTGGRFITEFEEKFAGYVGMESAVSTQSGTAGLHLALKAIDVQEREEIIVPTLTFVAAVNPVRYLGANPIFMDCDDTLCIDTNKLEEFLKNECTSASGLLINKRTGNRIRGIIVVHVFGNLCNMEKIMDLAKEYKLSVIEDATEALGSYVKDGRHKGRFAGTIGDIGVYSFNANKIITTGGGGMVVSNNRERLEYIRYLSLTAKNDSLYFVHDEVGYNYRMLNLQAALGVDQIERLEDFIRIKRSNYDAYADLINDIKGVTILPFQEQCRPNYWFYSLLIDSERFGMSRDDLMHKLIADGIQCRPVWKLIHTLEPYQSFQSYQIEKAIFYEKNILNVPCSTNLTIDDVNFICTTIKGYIQ